MVSNTSTGSIGLSLDSENGDSADNLATKVSEAQLKARIQTLNLQLQTAKQALNQLSKNSKFISLDEIQVGPPASRKGYLFKWADRSVGWNGSKWALRFVSLDGKSGNLEYYGSHLDAQPRYVLNLRGCAVRDDGWKRNQRHKKRTEEADPPLEEPGAYFFLFSIYQLPTGTPDVHTNDMDVVPLLRFSTPGMAERALWIQSISEACAYCETEEWQRNEESRLAELEKQSCQQASMTVAMPEAKEGTLPPLYFAPHKNLKLKRRPSLSRKPSAAEFRSQKVRGDADAQDAQSTRGYPPSKPMHRTAQPSYLSLEAPVQNYRGFFNLGVLILIVSNIRLLAVNISKYGFVVPKLMDRVKNFTTIRQDPWEEAPFISGFLLQLVFITIAFCIEWLLGHKKIPNTWGMLLHHLNAHSALVFPLLIVWTLIDKPPIGAVLLLHATITWMKLLSYALANEDYRTSQDSSMLALIEDLDPADAETRYPQNVTLRNMLYFWFCPSLTYQIAFPKSPRRRLWKIGGILMRMVVCLALFTLLVTQVVEPVLSQIEDDLEVSGGSYTLAMMVDYGLKLSIANTYLWLLMFYFYFHLYLNLFAELLRFGDRVFYKDWWNSSEVSAYWRLWNMPVHFWLVRHIYFPCVRRKLSRTTSTFLVFLISAVMHEVLVSVPFHMVRPWSFIGMMLQIPLVQLTKSMYRSNPGSSIGNLIFWLSFCVVGQPMAVLLYTVDYQYAHRHAGLAGECVVGDIACIAR